MSLEISIVILPVFPSYGYLLCVYCGHRRDLEERLASRLNLNLDVVDLEELDDMRMLNGKERNTHRERER